MNMISDRPYEALNYFKVNTDVISEVKAMASQQMNAGAKAISISGANNSSQEHTGRISELTSSELQEEYQRPEKQNLTSYDYAQTYDANMNYNLKGEDSELASLDQVPSYLAQKKDQVLSQYSTFVMPSMMDANASLQPEITASVLENFNI